MSDTPRCYAVRRLNPFLGVTEVVEIEGARALSSDGLSWQIQVEADRPDHTWGRDTPSKPVRQFFRFGNWDTDRGLSRVPVNPILDVGAMLAASERMVTTLQSVIGQLPFPFADRVEHWLLDTAGQPLALLAATVDARHIAGIRADHWQATPLQYHDFVAASLTARQIPACDQHGNRHHADTLERQLQDAAGPLPLRGWYQRQPDGSALPLGAGQAALPADAFPCLPWREHWPGPDHAALMRDYQHWLAPQLLTLPELTDVLRRDLEQAACRQALQMSAQHRLYPRVLQPQMLNTARVEAQLRRSAG